MPQYYFHLDNQHLIEDDEGKQFETLGEAEAYAREIAQQLSAHQTEEHNRGRYVRVLNEQGKEVFRALLAA